MPVTRLAKWKTTMQLVAIGALLIAPALQGAKSGILIDLGLVFFWVTAIVTLYTGYDYFRAGLKHLVREPDAGPLFRLGARADRPRRGGDRARRPG